MLNYFAVGDYIHLVDPDFQLNRYSRILGFERNILRPYQYKLTVGDAISKERVIELIKDVKRIDIKIKK
jgi:hypothetical protein